MLVGTAIILENEEDAGVYYISISVQCTGYTRRKKQQQKSRERTHQHSTAHITQHNNNNSSIEDHSNGVYEKQHGTPNGFILTR